MSISKNKIKKVIQLFQRKYEKVVYGGCAVLLYHRVTNLETDPQLLSVSPENFDKQISFLKKKYRLLSIDEFQFYLKNKKRFPNKSVLLTFDDGYADNFLEALPILENQNAQALFYISTGTLNTDKEYWWDAVERIVLLSNNKSLIDFFELNNKQYNLRNLDKDKRFELYNNLLPELRKMNSILRQNKIVELESVFNSSISRATHRAMTFDELKKMNLSKSAIIGAHTHLHPSLAALNYEEQLLEIETSKKILETQLNKNIIHFSYPFGTINDFNNNTIKILKKLGFEFVAANIPNLINKKTDCFSFPRFLVRNWNETEFKNELTSFTNS